VRYLVCDFKQALPSVEHGEAGSPVVDFHTHAFPDALAPRALAALSTPEHPALTDATVAGLLGSMDRSAVDISVLCSIATAPKQAEAILEWSIGIADERVVPFASVHPSCPDAYQATARVAAAGLKGVKLHPQYQGFFADSTEAWPIYRSAADHGLIVLFHAGYDLAYPQDPRAQPNRIAAVAREFPGLRIVAAHLGGWQDWEESIRHLVGTEVYLDTAFALARGRGAAPESVVRTILDVHDPERVLLGSDSPWRDPTDGIAAVRDRGLSREQEEGILGGNACRLLGIR
jgi:hypothetical protein